MEDSENGHELLILSKNILGSNTERRKNPDFVGSQERDFSFSSTVHFCYGTSPNYGKNHQQYFKNQKEKKNKDVYACVPGQLSSYNPWLHYTEENWYPWR